MNRRITKARCKLCAHPERARIDMTRLAGVGAVLSDSSKAELFQLVVRELS